jgi:ATP-dependent Clp protease ATP-binding subunit ClpB
MDFNRFTEKVQESLRSAQALALRKQNQQVDIEHELVALLEQQNGLAAAILKRAEVQPEGLKERLEKEIEKFPKVTLQSGGENQIYVTARLTKLFADAEAEAKKSKDDFLSVEHVLLAALEDRTGRGWRRPSRM